MAESEGFTRLIYWCYVEYSPKSSLKLIATLINQGQSFPQADHKQVIQQLYKDETGVP